MGGAERNAELDLTQHAIAALPVQLGLNCNTSGPWTGPVMPTHLPFPREPPWPAGSPTEWACLPPPDATPLLL